MKVTPDECWASTRKQTKWMWTCQDLFSIKSLNCYLHSIILHLANTFVTYSFWLFFEGKKWRGLNQIKRTFRFPYIHILTIMLQQTTPFSQLYPPLNCHQEMLQVSIPARKTGISESTFNYRYCPKGLPILALNSTFLFSTVPVHIRYKQNNGTLLWHSIPVLCQIDSDNQLARNNRCIPVYTWFHCIA